MLTEEYRGKIIHRVRDKVDFTYNGWDPNPKILRYFEGHDWKEPQILFKFLPANRIKFQSIGNLIGPATPNGQYKQFGYCQPELVTILCYAGQSHKDREIDGRLLAAHFAETLIEDVLKNWNTQLETMGATIEESQSVIPTDRSMYHKGTRSFTYVYELSFFILTQVRWDDKPSDYDEDEGEELVNIIGGINYPENIKKLYNIDLNNI